jgi:uncharacterized protein (TIGR01777 family)
MRVILVGGSGMVGQALAASLAAASHDVHILTRTPPRSGPAGIHFVAWDGRTASGWGHLVDGADSVVNLAGETIGGTNLGEVFFQRWTAAKKNRILESRLNAGRAIVEAVQAARTPPAMLLQMSAVGFYGPRGDEDIDESAAPGTDFLARVCVEWERSTLELERLGVRRIVTRTGLVLSQRGGLFPVALLPFRLFVGGPLGRGRQGFSWMHAEDHHRALRFLIELRGASGTYNLTAPEPVTNAQLGRAVARALRRPYWFPTPAFLLRLVLGEKAMLVLEGQRVLPRRLLEAGFEFHHPRLDEALEDLLARR